MLVQATRNINTSLQGFQNTNQSDLIQVEGISFDMFKEKKVSGIRFQKHFADPLD